MAHTPRDLPQDTPPADHFEDSTLDTDADLEAAELSTQPNHTEGDGSDSTQEWFTSIADRQDHEARLAEQSPALEQFLARAHNADPAQRAHDTSSTQHPPIVDESTQVRALPVITRNMTSRSPKGVANDVVLVPPAGEKRNHRRTVAALVVLSGLSGSAAGGIWLAGDHGGSVMGMARRPPHVAADAGWLSSLGSFFDEPNAKVAEPVAPQPPYLRTPDSGAGSQGSGASSADKGAPSAPDPAPAPVGPAEPAPQPPAPAPAPPADPPAPKPPVDEAPVPKPPAPKPKPPAPAPPADEPVAPDLPIGDPPGQQPPAPKPPAGQPPAPKPPAPKPPAEQPPAPKPPAPKPPAEQPPAPKPPAPKPPAAKPGWWDAFKRKLGDLRRMFLDDAEGGLPGIVDGGTVAGPDLKNPTQPAPPEDDGKPRAVLAGQLTAEGKVAWTALTVTAVTEGGSRTVAPDSTGTFIFKDLGVGEVRLKVSGPGVTTEWYDDATSQGTAQVVPIMSTRAWATVAWPVTTK